MIPKVGVQMLARLPLSGYLNADATQHSRAWPCDGYFIAQSRKRI
jgi:hypothetical protein